MTIIKIDSRSENDKKALYKLTKNPETAKLADQDGSRLEVSAYCLYDESTEPDTEKQILAIMTKEGEVFGTNSKTAITGFLDILEIFEDDLNTAGFIPVKVVSSKSKNNRTFIMLVYAD